MKIRSLAGVVAVALFMASFVAPGVAATRGAAIVMVPLVGIKRIDSPDRPFIERAVKLSVATMDRADVTLTTAKAASVAAEAVRAFNTSAASYNQLADIAVKRRIALAVPSSIYARRRSRATVDGVPIVSTDVAYVNGREETLRTTMELYREEIAHGHDPLVVAFAKKFAPRLQHDFALATISKRELDRPAAATTVGGAVIP